MYQQLRNDSFWDYKHVQGAELNATLSASCPGESVSAKVQAISGNYSGAISKESFAYQTGKLHVVNCLSHLLVLLLYRTHQ